VTDATKPIASQQREDVRCDHRDDLEPKQQAASDPRIRKSPHPVVNTIEVVAKHAGHAAVAV
jgi:hypothetical protein